MVRRGVEGGKARPLAIRSKSSVVLVSKCSEYCCYVRLGRTQRSIYPTDNYFEEFILLDARIKEIGTPTESGSLLARLMPVGQ